MSELDAMTRALMLGFQRPHEDGPGNMLLIDGKPVDPGSPYFQGRVSISPPPVAWIGPTNQLMPHEIFVAWREQYPDQGHEHFRPLVYGDAA